jgi:hypothetical protein
MIFSHRRSVMRPTTALLAILFGTGCAAEQSDAAPDSSEGRDCADRVERARSEGSDSLFTGAGELVQSCPDAMAVALAALWSEPQVSPARARTLRAVSGLVRDARLLSAVESAVRDQSRPVETRVEALSTLSYHLQAGRWIEFTFLQGAPDSASLRMFVGSMELTISGAGSQPVPADYPVAFRGLLESLRDTDSSSAMRSAARRFLVFMDYSRQQLEKERQNPPPPAPPPG